MSEPTGWLSKQMIKDVRLLLQSFDVMEVNPTETVQSCPFTAEQINEAYSRIIERPVVIANTDIERNLPVRCPDNTPFTNWELGVINDTIQRYKIVTAPEPERANDSERACDDGGSNAQSDDELGDEMESGFESHKPDIRDFGCNIKCVDPILHYIDGKWLKTQTRGNFCFSCRKVFSSNHLFTAHCAKRSHIELNDGCHPKCCGEWHFNADSGRLHQMDTTGVVLAGANGYYCRVCNVYLSTFHRCGLHASSEDHARKQLKIYDL